MKKQFRKATQSEVTMTQLMGYVRADYKTLVKVFGRPHYRNNDKVTAEWNIMLNNGEVATIYDWKERKTPKDAYNWHIGGNNRMVVAMIQNLIYGG